MMFRTFFTRDKGFSVIELLVTLVVIGVLAGIAIPRLMMSYDKARDKKVVADIRSIATALGIYRVDYNRFPDVADYGQLVQTIRSAYGSLIAVPDKDAWGHAFIYRSVSNGSEYTLKSLGKDRLENLPASSEYFDANADTIIINGSFAANHVR